MPERLVELPSELGTTLSLYQDILRSSGFFLQRSLQVRLIAKMTGRTPMPLRIAALPSIVLVLELVLVLDL